MADQVARALNSLSDGDFTRSLSSRDQRDLGHFIEDFFCSAPNAPAEEEEKSEFDEEQAGWDLPAPEMEVHVSTSEPASSQSACSNDEGSNSDTEEGDEHMILNVPEMVAERVALQLGGEGPVEIEPRPIDDEEDERLREFTQRGCGCTVLKNGPCSTQFTLDHYRTVRANCAELSWGELNMALTGQQMALTNELENGSHPAERERSVTRYLHCGLRVCRNTFRFLHGVGSHRLKALKAHYLANGLESRRHGNTGRVPRNALSLEDVQHVVQFILHYSEANGILLPGRIPGYKKDDMQLLPCSTTRRKVWLVYQQATEELLHKTAAYSTFCKLWKQLLPQVVVARPMTDLCLTCQQNSTAIIRSANLCEEVKSETLRAAEEHLLRATSERSYYRTAVKDSKDAVHEFYTVDDVFSPPPAGTAVASGVGPQRVHYSFDFAQQVHYPHNPMQPGPIYFKTPRKCAVFGVCCEAIPRQVHYLVDEASDTGKGANTVVSFLHHFFHHHGLGESELALHADNCTGQNKNNTVLQVREWREIKF
jgi:hypothetical protein